MEPSAGRSKSGKSRVSCYLIDRMTVTRTAILCACLAQVITVAGCSATPHANPNNGTSSNQDKNPMPHYDETAHYNAVKNLWFGLDDPTVSQDKSAP
jgi:hypothetical protein